ncbi:hypothetical protein NX059_000320 [Plenodomus lindquistii]|nr:hypothetical protein NX059_000320 [Plenodomus lindquistii]
MQYMLNEDHPGVQDHEDPSKAAQAIVVVTDYLLYPTDDPAYSRLPTAVKDATNAGVPTIFTSEFAYTLVTTKVKSFFRDQFGLRWSVAEYEVGVTYDIVLQKQNLRGIMRSKDLVHRLRPEAVWLEGVPEKEILYRAVGGRADEVVLAFAAGKKVGQGKVMYVGDGGLRSRGGAEWVVMRMCCS